MKLVAWTAFARAQKIRYAPEQASFFSTTVGGRGRHSVAGWLVPLKSNHFPFDIIEAAMIPRSTLIWYVCRQMGHPEHFLAFDATFDWFKHSEKWCLQATEKAFLSIPYTSIRHWNHFVQPPISLSWVLGRGQAHSPTPKQHQALRQKVNISW